MMEMLDTCPLCDALLNQAEYDSQRHSCGWAAHAAMAADIELTFGFDVRGDAKVVVRIRKGTPGGVALLAGIMKLVNDAQRTGP